MQRDKRKCWVYYTVHSPHWFVLLRCAYQDINPYDTHFQMVFSCCPPNRSTMFDFLVLQMGILCFSSQYIALLLAVVRLPSFPVWITTASNHFEFIWQFYCRNEQKICWCSWSNQLHESNCICLQASQMWIPTLMVTFVTKYIWWKYNF